MYFSNPFEFELEPFIAAEPSPPCTTTWPRGVFGFCTFPGLFAPSPSNATRCVHTFSCLVVVEHSTCKVAALESMRAVRDDLSLEHIDIK